MTSGAPAPAEGLVPAPEPPGLARARFRLRILLVLGIVLGCVGCDRVTKQVAASELPGQRPIGLLGDTVLIQYAENRGAFLGLGDEWPPHVRAVVLVFGTACALLALAAFLVRHRHGALLPLVAAALVLGGGLGNLFDRVTTGKVVDFVIVALGPLRTGIFNAADVAITSGAVLLFVSALRREGDTPDLASEAGAT